MKFIRTKENHIFKIEENITDEEINSKKYAMLYRGEEIIKQAETIEEICDEALFFNKEGKPNYRSNQSVTYWNLGANLFRDSVRFAIFTNTGLKYVAKLNEEGDVELL